MYDFANQPFTTLIVTFIFSAYYTQAIAPNIHDGTFLWSIGIAITALFVAFVSPLMGALADQGGYRKILLIFWSWICILSTIFLFFTYEGQIYIALFWFVIANIGFEMGSVFCNAYLPHIAPKDKIGRISGYGWSLGYVGGLIALMISLFLFVQPNKPIFNLKKNSSINSIIVDIENVEISNTFSRFTISPSSHNVIDSIQVGMPIKLINFELTDTLAFMPDLVYKNETEKGTVADIDLDSHSFVIFGSHPEYINHKDRSIQLIGKPSWNNYNTKELDSKTGFVLDEKNNFEIRGPIYEDDKYVGTLCYFRDGRLKIVDNPNINEISVKTSGENIRGINLLVALWFALFAIPTFLGVKDHKINARISKKLIYKSYSQIRQTFKEIKQYKHIVRFLIARILYNDGLVTIFSFGGIYASGTFGFSFNEVMYFGIALNVAAGLGAFLFGFLDDWIGGKNTIQLSNIGLIIACALAVFTTNVTVFWIAGILIGLCSGPNQASSRSLMSRFTPKDKQNEFFGFFAFSGKATAFIGPMLLGILTREFGSQRYGVAIVLVLILAGAYVLHSLDEKAAVDDSKA
tara:strand:+ start:25421 stop:27148 length:1728 start_codon:yes stop_codon:yes gene_type:complete